MTTAPEVISACENVCRDFSWFPAFAAVLADVGTLMLGIGVFAAFAQLRATRLEATRRRRAELAEEIIVLSHQVADAFRHMRNRLDSIPAEKVRDKEFVYKKRYERIVETNDLFGSLRETQVRLEAVIPSADLEKHVSGLLNARSEVIFAIEDLIDFYNDGERAVGTDEVKDARRTLYGTWSKKDDLGRQILDHVDQIQKKARKTASFI